MRWFIAPAIRLRRAVSGPGSPHLQDEKAATDHINSLICASFRDSRWARAGTPSGPGLSGPIQWL